MKLQHLLKPYGFIESKTLHKNHHQESFQNGVFGVASCFDETIEVFKIESKKEIYRNFVFRDSDLIQILKQHNIVS